jgi:hypothetical protein
MCVQILEDSKGRDHLGDLGIDGKKNLTEIEGDGVNWIHLVPLGFMGRLL